MKKVINKGFTLIELLVVIAIIGILASIVLVSLNSARNKGKDTRIISDINQIRTQIESEANNAGTYTGGTGASNCLSSATVTLNDASTICSKTTAGGLGKDAIDSGGAITVKTWPTTAGTSYNAYAIYSSNNSGSGYCVDSSGKTGTGIPTTYTSATAGGC